MPQPRHLQFITRVHRAVFLRERRIENHSMKQCWNENGWELPLKYLPSVPNISAGYKAFWRYDKPEKSIDPYASRMSMVWTQRHFQPFMGGARVLPVDLVRREMDSSTSCGYPWNMTYSNKEKMYEDARMSQVIPDYAAIIRTNYPCGVVPIWTCSVKGQEMRSVEKIRANNLRTFTAAPVEHSTATNVLCLDMNDRFYAAAGHTWSQVGATKFDGQWHAMHTRLSKHRNAAALDGKQFDASLLAQMLWDQMWIRWEMLEPEYRTMENLLAMMNLYESIIASAVVLDCGDLIRKLLGNPSGSSNTVVDNTMVLFRMMCIAWIILCKKFRAGYMDARRRANLPVRDPDHGEREMEIDDFGYESFMKNVEAALYGDDDTFTVSDFVREWFTPRAIAEVWTELGLTTTADNWDFAALDTLTFLSQNFVCIAGLWMPSPETEKVLGSLYLGSSVDDIRFHLLRAYALRIESWANVECRNKITTYINFVHRHYRDQLYGIVKDIPMLSIRQVWKTDNQIMRLYSGEESWVNYPPAWRLVCVELNPGPTRTGLIMHILFKVLFTIDCALKYNIQIDIVINCVICQMTKTKKKGVKKAVKKEAVKEVKKALRKSGPRRAKGMKRNVLHGKGGYWGDLGKRLGGHIGGVADEVVGIGKALAGRGSYRVKSNSIYESGGPPSIINSKYTSIIRHREYLGDVTGSVAFNVTSYPINPGVSQTFPWLSATANTNEQYRIKGMIFEFHSTSANSVTSTNTALGTVIMATEYNTNLPNFTSKMQMENHEYATSVSPVNSAIHPIECARSRTVLDELYVRSALSGAPGAAGNQPANYNPLLYDLGNFQIATVGMQAAAVVGELWVSYEIEFLKPSMSATTTGNRLLHFYWDSTLGSAPSSGALLSNLREVTTRNTLATGATFVTMAPGNWLIFTNAAYSGTAATTVAVPTVTGAATLATTLLLNSGGVGTTNCSMSPPNGTTTQYWTQMVSVSATGPWSFVTGTATLGTLTSYEVIMIPYGAGLTDSRRAVDYDPVALLYQKLQLLETKLATVVEHEDEKYCDSECSTPLHVEPGLLPPVDMTRSQQDFATTLLSRLNIRDRVVTPKTAHVQIA